MKGKANYLILADIMLEHDDMKTFVEWATFVEFSLCQIDSIIESFKHKDEYKLLVDRTGIKSKYGLKKMDYSLRERDFITELFSGHVTKAIELSRLVVKCEE